MPVVTLAAIPDPFISPTQFTKPERRPLPEGPYTKGWFIASTFNIRSQWQVTESLIFVIRVYDKKLDHILEPLVAKYRPDLFVRLRDIAEKQVPADLKPIVRYGSGSRSGLEMSPESNIIFRACST